YMQISARSRPALRETGEVPEQRWSWGTTTTSVDTQGGGAAGRSDRRAASRGGRTTEGRVTSSSQTGGGAARAGPVRLRPGSAVPEAPADAPGPAPPGVRLGDTQSPLAAPNPPRTGA